MARLMAQAGGQCGPWRQRRPWQLRRSQHSRLRCRERRPKRSQWPWAPTVAAGLQPRAAADVRPGRGAAATIALPVQAAGQHAVLMDAAATAAVTVALVRAGEPDTGDRYGARGDGARGGGAVTVAETSATVANLVVAEVALAAAPDGPAATVTRAVQVSGRFRPAHRGPPAPRALDMVAALARITTAETMAAVHANTAAGHLARARLAVREMVAAVTTSQPAKATLSVMTLAAAGTQRAGLVVADSLTTRRRIALVQPATTGVPMPAGALMTREAIADARVHRVAAGSAPTATGPVGRARIAPAAGKAATGRGAVAGRAAIDRSAATGKVAARGPRHTDRPTGGDRPPRSDGQRSGWQGGGSRTQRSEGSGYDRPAGYARPAGSDRPSGSGAGAARSDYASAVRRPRWSGALRLRKAGRRPRWSRTLRLRPAARRPRWSRPL